MRAYVGGLRHVLAQLTLTGLQSGRELAPNRRNHHGTPDTRARVRPRSTQHLCRLLRERRWLAPTQARRGSRARQRPCDPRRSQCRCPLAGTRYVPCPGGMHWGLAAVTAAARSDGGPGRRLGLLGRSGPCGCRPFLRLSRPSVGPSRRDCRCRTGSEGRWPGPVGTAVLQPNDVSPNLIRRGGVAQRSGRAQGPSVGARYLRDGDVVALEFTGLAGGVRGDPAG